MQTQLQHVHVLKHSAEEWVPPPRTTRSDLRPDGRCTSTALIAPITGTAPKVLFGVPARRSLTCVSRKQRAVDFSVEKSRFMVEKSRFRVSREPDPMGGFNRWSVRAVCFAGAQMWCKRVARLARADALSFCWVVWVLLVVQKGCKNVSQCFRCALLRGS